MTVNDIVTDTILSKMEECERTGKRYYWVKPFADGSPRQAFSYEKSIAYSGINRLLLEADEYLTFNKAQELGCSIRQGAKANIVVYFNVIPLKDKVTGEILIDENGKERTRGVLRYYRVFSRQDVLDETGNNLPSKFNIKQYSHREMSQQMRDALLLFTKLIEDYCRNNGLRLLIIREGTEACYVPSQNLIKIPAIENFSSVYEYMHTVAHEVIHSTMKPLNRKTSRDKVPEETRVAYGKEELVAEIGAEMLLQNFGIPDDRAYKNNSIAYLQGWSNYLKNRRQELVLAAAKAQDACDYVLEYIKERMCEHAEEERMEEYDL